VWGHLLLLLLLLWDADARGSNKSLVARFRCFNSATGSGIGVDVDVDVDIVGGDGVISSPKKQKLSKKVNAVGPELSTFNICM